MKEFFLRVWDAIVSLLVSRKMFLAAAAVYAIMKGLPAEAYNAQALGISAVTGALILGIAHEDNGAKRSGLQALPTLRGLRRGPNAI